MGKIYFLLIISTFLLLLDISCREKDEAEGAGSDMYVITGTAIDQVTRQPEAGATIIYGWIPTGSWGYQLVSSGRTTTSGQDGRYKILIPKLALDPSYIRNSLNYPKIYAEKEGYAGSNYLVPTQGGEMSEYIELYHSATLSLHVKNDTINNQIDAVDIGLIGSTEVMSYPQFIGQTSDFWDPKIYKTCKGRNIDTVFEFYPLWGNLIYRLTLKEPGQAWGAPGSTNYSVTLKPDSVTYLSVSF
jgi:hypothetical protein